MKSRFSTRLCALSAALMLAGSLNAVQAETLTILHIGDQESWLLSAQGNLRDNATQAISFYGGIDRLATVVANRKAAAPGTVLTLNAGDSLLPGVRLNASFANGTVVSTRSVSLTTIDFMAAGGDNYPFPANGVAFENSVSTILYQEALSQYIRTPKAQGGLQRVNAADGDEVTANAYPVANAYDRHGRLIDLAIAQPTPGSTLNGTPGRDTLVGTPGDDVITAGAGADTVTGGEGGDIFRFTSTRDAGDTINDFTPYADRLDLSALLVSLRVSGNGVATGHVRFVDVIGGVQVLLDTDGTAGPATARPLVTLKGLTAAQMAAGRDLLAPAAP